MALRRCRNCTTVFAVGLNVCPSCGSKDHHEEGAPPALSELKRDELFDEAKERGLEPKSSITKPDLLKLLQAS
jgi:hypothetical protein